MKRGEEELQASDNVLTQQERKERREKKVKEEVEEEEANKRRHEGIKKENGMKLERENIRGGR